MSQLVVLCHGFGAPGTDLVGLADEFVSDEPEIAHSTRFVFPEAPIDLGPLGMPGGRAWWPINMQQLAEMHQTQNFDDLVTVTPHGLEPASDALADCVRAAQEEYNVADEHLFLGGFSQGAMVTTNITLRQQLQPAQLIVMSGTLICRDDWTRLAMEHPGCSVIQTHGQMDMVLPFEASTWLAKLLSDNGFDVNFQSFFGGHGVPPEAIDAIKCALRESLNR